mgnify:CR=1 FL=1
MKVFNHCKTGVLLAALLASTLSTKAQDNGSSNGQGTAAVTYNLYINGELVTEENRKVLNDGAIVFDGDSTIILQDAYVQSIESGLGKGLRIHILGNDNVLENEDGGTVIYSTSQTEATPTLTFTTDGNEPGCASVSTGDFCSGFNVEYQNGLALKQYAFADYEAFEIEATLAPLFSGYDQDDEQQEPTPVTVEFEDDDFMDGDEPISLANTVVNGILYTMPDSETDGYDVVDGTGNIVFGTPMTADQIDDAMQYEPGTDEFAATFTGATFKVPAGTGNIILTVTVDAGGVMMVKVGNKEPMAISGVEGDVTIPYVCAEPTYVYVYNGTPAAETAPMDGIRRDKKISIVVRMSGVSVEPDLVQQLSAPSADALSLKYLGAEGFSVVNHVVRVNDLSITALSDGLFKNVKARVFDLSGTSIDGTTVSRSRGAFEGVDDDAFIYLPVGNTADEGEPNVVIGAVCEDMQIDGDSQETAFLAGMDFSANVTLKQELAAGQTSTIYLPFAVSKEEAAAIGTFYTFKAINSQGDAELEETENGLEANTPYIYKKTTAENAVKFANVKVKQLPEVAVTSASLIGTYEYKEFTAEEAEEYLYDYAANKEAGAGVEAGEFVRITAGTFIKPYHAYLKLDSNAGARVRINVGGDYGYATGIADATMHTTVTTGQQLHNLSGQRVKTPQRGLYILNGRKAIVK